MKSNASFDISIKNCTSLQEPLFFVKEGFVNISSLNFTQNAGLNAILIKGESKASIYLQKSSIMQNFGRVLMNILSGAQIQI